jgi:predicted MFS family arabinose efflux permease
VFFQVAWTAYLPAMFDADDLVGANSVLQGSESAVQIAGPAVGGALVAAVNAVAGLLVDALTFVASAVSLLLIRRPERRPIPDPAGLSASSPTRPSSAPSVAASRPSTAPSDTASRPSSAPSVAASRPSSAPSVAASRSPAASGTPGFPARRRPARRSIGRDIAEGVRWLAREPLLRSLTLHGAAGNIALTGYGAIIVVFLVRDIGVRTATVGLLMAASGLGGVAAATATPFLVRRFGAARTMVRAKAGAGLASLLIPLTGPGYGLIAFVAGTGLVAACVVGGNVVAGSFRQTYVPPALLGRVVTGMQFVNLGAIPLGALLGGAVATALSTRGAIWCMTIFYACAGLILILGPWRGRRDLPAPAPATHSPTDLVPTA